MCFFTLVDKKNSKERRKDWRSFDDFCDSQTSVWEVRNMSQETYLNASCSCLEGQKKNVCKYSLDLAIRLKFCEPPLAAVSLPIGEKTKRGRPAKAKQALIRQ